MFVDKVTIKASAGRGGNGKVSFRHTVNQRGGGGPDGGDGGRGGNILVRADHNTSSLYKYRSAKVYRAQDGTAGTQNNRHGKNGEDLVLIVAPGTVVSVGDTVLADLTNDQDQILVAQGGNGGYGNAHFTSSTRQAPRFAELGEEGEIKSLTFEMKMIAEVGLIGLPNAGKSTLLSVISNARPEIANYAFTTLVPNLGVVEIDGASVLFADIPGLIEGASTGRGLGDEFLRHVERTRVLVHLIDTASVDVVADWQTINTELANYSETLATKPQLVTLSKIDTVDEVQLEKQVTKLTKQGLRLNHDLFTISASAHRHTPELLRAIKARLAQADMAPIAEDELPVIRLDDTSNHWSVSKVDDVYIVSGTSVERIAARTNFDQYEAVARLKNILLKRGVWREIERQGGTLNSKIKIGRQVFTWSQ